MGRDSILGLYGFLIGCGSMAFLLSFPHFGSIKKIENSLTITTYQEASNNYAVANFPDGVKVPMIQLPNGIYTNLAGFYDNQRKKNTSKVIREISAEERDITKKLIGEAGR